MRYPINDRFVLQRCPVGPLVPWLRGLAEALNARKYSHDTIHQQLRRIVLFSEWLEQQQIELPSLSSEDVTQYLRTRSLRSQQLSARPSLRHLMDYLRCVGVISPEEPVRPPTPAERCVQEYAQYLREQRDLADGTIVNYAIRARNFLQHRFGNGEVVLSQLNAGDLIAFARHETARLTSRGSMKSVTGSLRAFLRYVHAHAARMPDLAHQVPTVAGWAMTSVPRGIAADQVQKMLTSVDRSTPVGRRPVFVDTFRLCGGGVQMPKTHSPYAPEYRRQMVELVRSGRTPGELAREFECSASAIRNWVRQADRDEGRREDGLTSSELEELRRLRRDNRQLREEREILAKATAWFARETGSVRAKSSSS